MVYEPRTYRRSVAAGDLVSFEVCVKETDLLILAKSDLSSEAADLTAAARWEIEEYISRCPRFAESLAPLDVPKDAAPLVIQMADAGAKATVGPMAAVAGAIAQRVAEGLSAHSDTVIVENGGDIYMIGSEERVLGLYAGDSPLTGVVGIRVPAALMPVAACTSSGTVGHSLSLGVADAVTVLARDGALADAVATALANRVQGPADVEHAVEAARAVHGVLGVLVVVGERMGAWGNMRLMSLDASADEQAPGKEGNGWTASTS